MSDSPETLRDVFAGMCAMALIMRGIPDDAVPAKAYEMADQLLDARDPKTVGLPAIKPKKYKKEVI